MGESSKISNFSTKNETVFSLDIRTENIQKNCSNRPNYKNKEFKCSTLGCYATLTVEYYN